MRQVSAQWRANVTAYPRWVTRVDWTNNGGRTWLPAQYLPGGQVTVDSESTTRWHCQLSITTALLDGEYGPAVEPTLDSVNAFTTQIRVWHGMPGELLPMGRYRVDTAAWSDEYPNTVEVTGSSFEAYLIDDRFETQRTFQPQPAEQLVTTLIQETIPGANIVWQGVDGSLLLPKLVEPRDRWALIDGDRESPGIARVLGARVFAGAAGEFVVAPVPTLDDPVQWEARGGVPAPVNAEDTIPGALLGHSEQLSREGVRNKVVVTGGDLDSEVPTFPPGIAVDNDPFSPTYVGRPVTQGGFGIVTAFYHSPIIKTQAGAIKTAQTLLAPRLGLKQRVEFDQFHNPAVVINEVGILHTVKGPRQVILDALDYSLDGDPMTGRTRTTTTRLDTAAPQGDVEDTAEGDSEGGLE